MLRGHGAGEQISERRRERLLRAGRATGARTTAPQQDSPPGAGRPAPAIAGNWIAGNNAGRGGGIRFCYFTGSHPEPLVTGNTIVDNTADYGGGVHCFDADPVCTNLTMSGNLARVAGGGGCVDEEGVLTLHDCIVAGNLGGGGLFASQAGRILTDHCDVWGNAGGDYLGCVPAATDLSCDPRFCDLSANDMSLYEISCCQGTGAGGGDIGAHGVGCFTIPGVLFYDNFGDQNDDGWTVETGGNGALEVASGTYQGLAESASDWARGVAGSQAIPFTDFRCWFETRVGTAPIAPGGWIEFYLRYVDLWTFYVVRVSDTGGEVWKFAGSGGHLLAQFDCSPPPQEWVCFRFEMVGDLIRGFLSTPVGTGIDLFQVLDPVDPILAGRIGVGVQGGSGPLEVRYDDVMVATIDPAGVAWGAAPSNATVLVIRSRPNPSAREVTLEFTLPSAEWVDLAIYDVAGSLVRRLTSGSLPSGLHTCTWDGCDEQRRGVASGVYLCRMKVGGVGETSRLLRIR